MKRGWLSLSLCCLMVLTAGTWLPPAVAARPDAPVARAAPGPHLPDWLRDMLAALGSRPAAPAAPSDPGLVSWGSYCNANTAGEPPYDADSGADADPGRGHTWSISALNGGLVQDPATGNWGASASGSATGSHALAAYTHGCGTSASTPCSYRIAVSNAGYACGDICLYANGLNCAFARWQAGAGGCVTNVSASQNALNGLWSFGGASFHVNPCGGATATPTATASPTRTATRTATLTPTRTPSATAIATGTVTRTPTPAVSATPTTTTTRTPSAVPTATASATATATELPTATPTGTAMPTATASVLPTPTATATAVPVTLNLQAAYRYLLWYGPVTQLLNGQRRGPPPPDGQRVRIVVQAPDGSAATYTTWTRADGGFTLDSNAESDLGTTALGAWRAQAQDGASGVLSNVVAWDVKWFRIHLKQ